MIKTKVTGCEDCPFLNIEDIAIFWDKLTCNHPQTTRDLDIDQDEKQESPSWCPLKKEPITIEIEQ